LCVGLVGIVLLIVLIVDCVAVGLVGIVSKQNNTEAPSWLHSLACSRLVGSNLGSLQRTHGADLLPIFDLPF
jgi:hypothetical protein